MLDDAPDALCCMRCDMLVLGELTGWPVATGECGVIAKSGKHCVVYELVAKNANNRSRAVVSALLASHNSSNVQ